MASYGAIATTPPFRETSVKGVFAAGDCATQGKSVANAVATGSFTGAGVAAQLQAEPVPPAAAENGSVAMEQRKGKSEL